MTIRARGAIAVAFAASLVAAPFAAQSRRPPTPAEAQVLTRFIDAIASTVDRFADENWQVRDGTFPRDASQGSISIHSRLPLDDCIGGDRTWSVRENSPFFNARLKPLYERAKTLGDAVVAKYGARQDASAEMKELDGINRRIKSINQVTMEVCGNSPTIRAAALAPDAPSLLPGVAAHKVPADVCDGAPACYVLVYGDWKTARLSASHEYYDFHFVHPAASPYLENIVIRLKGSDERIQEMLKSADWTRVTASLGGPA